MRKLFLWILILCLTAGAAGCAKKETTASSVPKLAVATHAYDGLELGFGDFHTKAQAAYLADDVENIKPYGTGEGERSAPRGTEFILPVKEDAVSTVYLATSNDFSDAKTYRVNGKKLTVYNLLLDTEYYWKAEDVSGKVVSDIQSFHTTDTAPRNLSVKGVANVRDMGGWATADGRKLKQGVLYRGGRFNTNSHEEMTLEIKDAGIETLRNELCVKAEIDLRRVSDLENGNPDCKEVIEGIRYVSCPMDFQNAETFNDPGNIASLQSVFAVLGNEENYPVYFHCSVGTDRTGIVAFLINGYLGVRETDLYRDYAFSNFSVIGGPRSVASIREIYQTILSPYSGTLQEQIHQFLLDKGIKQKELDTLKKMMLG